MAKVAQSATATWAISMPSQTWSGTRDLFQTNFFLQGCISIFFYRDENQNWPKLQGRLSYLSLF